LLTRRPAQDAVRGDRGDRRGQPPCPGRVQGRRRL
jgi:hypothetical protein